MVDKENSYAADLVADRPLDDPRLDRFNRVPFAQRIADTLEKRRDQSSIVIGIYGAWGDGKTTVLNFIEEYLRDNEDVICARFNPWQFGEEAQMLRSFFETMANAIDRGLSTNKEKIGEWLHKYGDFLAPISVSLDDSVQISAAEGIKNVGSMLSMVELAELRKRIEKALKEEEKRVVILIDDIDRLDKSEIQIVFKLVKLTADFDYTAYVLAFDEEIVSASL